MTENKNLDLGPNDYRKQDPRTGRWHLPDDPKLARNMLIVPIVMLGYIFLNRGELTIETLFMGTAFGGFLAGGLIMLWLKDVY